MTGIPSIPITEARGGTAVTPGIDNLAVAIGCSSAGSGLSNFFLSGASAIADRGYGDGVELLTQVIEQRQEGSAVPKRPCAMYTTPASTAGSYGAVDVSGITGAGAVAAGSTQPYITAEAGLKWVTSGVVGADGMSVQYTLDDFRTLSAAVSLGTATTYTIPNTNITFSLTPTGINTTAVDTLLNEMKADINAHFALTAGGVHGAADTANTISTADASNAATRLALANAIRSALEAHRILVAGSVHGAADTTNAVAVEAATDESTVLLLALDLKAKYNAHIALTTGSVHGAADTSNATAATDPTGGTFTKGDTVSMRTFGPQPGATEIAEAFTTMASDGVNCGVVAIECDMTASLAASVTTGLNALAAVGVDAVAIVRTRAPDFEASETISDWYSAITADFANFDDDRIVVRASYGLLTDAVTTRQYRRSDLAQFAADVVRVDRFVWPCSPNDRPIPNLSLVDGNGSTVGHDEGGRGEVTGLSNDTLGNRFSAVHRLPDPSRREDVFNTVPWVMYPSDGRIRNLPTRRLVNAMKRVARASGTPGLGSRVFYTSTGPTTGNLTDTSREAIQARIFQALNAEFAEEINNANDGDIDAGLVQVAQAVTVSGGNLLTIPVTLAPEIGGFVLSLPITLSIQE